VAMRQGSAVYYFHTNHLGSVVLTTDAAGAAVSQTRYLPFGEEHWSSGGSLSDFTYTGQRNNDFGLMDYNARFYSSRLGRFASADTLIPGAGNPLAWDRYAGMVNNPIRFKDPSGHAQACADGDVGGRCGQNSTAEQIGRSFDYSHAGRFNGLFSEYYAKLFIFRREASRGNTNLASYQGDVEATYQRSLSFVPQREFDASQLIPGVTLGIVNLSTKDNGLGSSVIVFGQAGDPSIPQTRPGRDGKVSCSSCSPEEAIKNSFGRLPTEKDLYWELDVDQVLSAGGQVDYDGGQLVTDIYGNELGGTYPEGHVSAYWHGQSKGWVERNLLPMLGPAQPVIK